MHGISINLLLGDNGIIKKSTDAKEEYSKASVKEKVSLLLNEYTIDNSTGQSEDLAKFFRQNLQVGVAENDDNTYSFILDEYQIVTDKSSIISVEKFNLNTYKKYDSIETMKADTELTAGKLVQTEGYYNKSLGGGAYYDIVNTAETNVDNARCIALNNGLYAKLHVINDTVSVNQFGAYGDGEHDDIVAIKNAINSNFTNIEFENRQYKINNRLDIQSSNKYIIGKNSTIIYDDAFTFWDDYIIRIYKSNTDIIKNIYMSGINLINKNTIKNEECLMLKIMWAENIDITNCKLESIKVESNTERKVTNIDLRGYWKNINISNCNLINTTLAPAGGTIWIRAGVEGTGNLNFTNNIIKKSCHDESIAAFGNGFIDNINIEKNEIEIDDTNVQELSNPIINFGLDCTRLKNVKFKDNSLNIKSGGSFLLFANVDDIEIENNNMNLTSLSKGSTQYFVSLNDNRNIVFNDNYIEINRNDNIGANEIFDNIKNIKNNTLILNVKSSFIARNCSNFSGNSIYVNKDQEEYNSTITIQNNIYDTIQIENNNLNFSVKQTSNARFLNFYKTTIKNTRINVTNNIIKGVENQTDDNKYYIFFQNMKDTEPQKIYCKNNNFSFYNKKGIYQNLTEYNVIDE